MDRKPREYRILVVDDEPGIVQAVERELRRAEHFGGRYLVEGFTDPLAALQRTRDQHFDLVISDYRMPGLDGLQLLRAVAESQPDCARIVLSGQTDFEALVRMINETHIYRFIAKPWQDILLLAAVRQALDYAGMLADCRRLEALTPAADDAVLPTGNPEIEQILIVDDDPGVLAALSRVLTHRSRVDGLYAAIRADLPRHVRFAFDEHRFSVQVSPTPLYALQMAAAVPFACVISDFRMPEMDGITLLEKFAVLQPDCVRVLISGKAGADDLVRALAQAGIFAFIDKPWTDFDLKAAIAMALAHRRVTLEQRRLAAMTGGAA